MDGWRVECRAARERAAVVETLLASFGAQCVTISADDERTPFFESRPGMEPDWPWLRIEALFPPDFDAAPLRAALARAVATEPTIERLPARDWVRENRASFRPIHAGGNLWICPSWSDPPDPEAVNVILDPGSAFGTGRHPTTLLCLRWLAEHPPRGARVIDYGCGSGILAIAALKLGACEAVGVEIDELARETARENAQRNGVGASFQVQAPEEPLTAREVVLANILADTLIDLADELSNLTAPGGRILLSGILDTQTEGVRAAYSQFFDFRHFRLEGWSLLVGTRR